MVQGDRRPRGEYVTRGTSGHGKLVSGYVRKKVVDSREGGPKEDQMRTRGKPRDSRGIRVTDKSHGMKDLVPFTYNL